MSRFWDALPAGFIGLSPMDGVTDHPFRHIQKKYGNPDVMYTEFTSVEGITHGATRLLKDLMFDQTQHPILAQIFGHTPEDFRTVATIVCALGFDGVDINMGCPAKNIAHAGSGAALILEPQLAVEIIHSVQSGINDWVNGKNIDDLALTDEIKQTLKNSVSLLSSRANSLSSPPTNLSSRVNNLSSRAESRDLSLNNQPSDRQPIPVSIKTRIGYDRPVIEDWIPILLSTEPAAIAIHGRMLKQYYAGSANWDEIGKAAMLAKNSHTKIIGNGDVKSLSDAKQKIADYGVDGVLLGRVTMGNPWIFKDIIPSIEDRFAVALEHATLYEQTYSHLEKYSFLPMRKHFGWYLTGFRNASDLRQTIIRANDTQEVKQIFTKWGSGGR